MATQVIVPEEANSMLLGAAMLGMAAGEEEGLEAVVRKLQKISKVTELKDLFLVVSLEATIVYLFPYQCSASHYTYFQYRVQALCSTRKKRLKCSTKQSTRSSFRWVTIRENTGIINT